jgi:hypothetical protein
MSGDGQVVAALQPGTRPGRERDHLEHADLPASVAGLAAAMTFGDFGATAAGRAGDAAGGRPDRIG